MLKKTKKIIEQLLNENARLKAKLTSIEISAQSQPDQSQPQVDYNQVAWTNAWTSISTFFNDIQVLMSQLKQAPPTEQQKLLNVFINNYQHLLAKAEDQELLLNFVKNYKLITSSPLNVDYV